LGIIIKSPGRAPNILIQAHWVNITCSLFWNFSQPLGHERIRIISIKVESQALVSLINLTSEGKR
jgi:hypothetical protein